MFSENQILQRSAVMVAKAEKCFITGQPLPLQERDLFLRITKCVKSRRPLSSTATRLQKFLYDIFDAVVEVCTKQFENVKKCSIAEQLFKFCKQEEYDRPVLENFFRVVHYFFEELTGTKKIQLPVQRFSLN